MQLSGTQKGQTIKKGDNPTHCQETQQSTERDSEVIQTLEPSNRKLNVTVVNVNTGQH